MAPAEAQIMAYTLFHHALALGWYVLLITLCMVSHELGHVFAAWFYRVQVRKIGLAKLGMYVQRARTDGWPEIVICLAGPATNLALALIYRDANPWFALCNLSFGWVNLLPIAHSDGLHVWEAFSAMRRGESLLQNAEPVPVKVLAKVG
jgi:Zn-dependent protease